MSQGWPPVGWQQPPNPFMQSAASAPAGEQTLLSEPGVLVTTARFVVGTATFPIANISAVRLHYLPAQRAPAIVSALIGLVCFWFAWDGPGGLGTIILGVAASGLAIYAFVANKAQHVVMVSTAGVDRQGLITRDPTAARRVLDALNDALSRR